MKEDECHSQGVFTLARSVGSESTPSVKQSTYQSLKNKIGEENQVNTLFGVGFEMFWG